MSGAAEGLRLPRKPDSVVYLVFVSCLFCKLYLQTPWSQRPKSGGMGGGLRRRKAEQTVRDSGL